MKKKIFSLTLVFIMLIASCFSIIASAYEFGYYVDNVEYIGDGKAEATIVFTANNYGSNADIRCIGVLAVYDDITGQYLGCSMVAYDEYKPFLNTQRFKVTQTVDLKDLTKERYNFKMILLDSTEGMKPAGFISNGNNCFVMPQEAFVEKDTYYIETTLTAVSIDPTETRMAVNVTKYDDRLKEQGFGTSSVVGGVLIVPQYTITQLDISELNKEELYACTGYPCKIKIYMPDYTTVYAEEVTKIERPELNINPQLFAGIDTTSGAIRYYKNEEATTVNTSSKLEKTGIPINTYINLNYLDASCDTGSEIDALFNLSGTQKINTNNKNYKFVDRDNNGYYDALFVENSASFVVGKINAADYEIYRDNSTNIFNSSVAWGASNTYSFNPLVLDTSDDDVSYTIKDINGNKLSFSDIKVGDVLTVAWSFDGAINYYDITVSTASTVEGTISEVKTRKIKNSTEYITYYTINGNEYRINAKAQEVKLEAGVSGTFNLTAEGNIISYELSASDKSYGIVVATATKTGSFTNGYQAQIITPDGTAKTFDFASKVYNFTNSWGDCTIIDTTTTAISIPAGTIVIFETNNDDEIRKIYTTDAAIQAKENDDVKVKAISSAQYTALNGKIDGTYITENTNIIGIPYVGKVYDKDAYTAYSADSLANGETYNGIVVYDASSKEVTLAFITNLVVKPAYDSIPMIITGKSVVSVDGQIRNKYTGLINGEEYSYILADEEALVRIGITGRVNEDSYNIGVNDIIQFTLNKKDEINTYRHIVNYNESDNSYYAMLSTTGNEDSDDSTSAQLYNLNTMTLSGNQPTNAEVCGYGVAGKVYRTGASYMELFKQTDFEYDYELTSPVNLIDAIYNPENPIYFSGSTYTKIAAGYADNIESYDLTYNIAASDDVVYLYSFDGKNVASFVIDTLSDNTIGTRVTIETYDDVGDTLTLNPEMFNGISGSTIEYYVTESSPGTNPYLKIEAPFDIYVNDVLSESASNTGAAEKLINTFTVNKDSYPKNITSSDKQYVFKDTDGNKYYDTLYITNEFNIVAGEINDEEQTITPKYSSSIFNSPLVMCNGELLAEDYINLANKEYKIYDKNGLEISLSDINSGDILNIKYTEVGGVITYSITVNNYTAVSDSIDTVFTKKMKNCSEYITYYTINGTDYRINAQACDPKLEAGVSGIFNVTKDGLIVSYSLTESNKHYGIMIATAAKTGSFSSGYQAQIYTMGGNVATYDFASKVYVNDYTLVDTSYSPYGLNIAAGTIVLYETNSDNEIKKIYTTAEAISEKEYGNYNVMTFTNSLYNITSGRLKNKYITDKTVIAGISSSYDVNYKDAYFSIQKNYLVDSDKYNGTIVYDTYTDEIKFAFLTDFIVKPAYNSAPMVITDRSTANVDGALRTKFTGLVNGKEEAYVLADEEDLVMIDMSGNVGYSYIDIGINDVIQYVVNANNEIISYRPILDYDNYEGAYYALLSDDGVEFSGYSSAKLYNLNTMTPADGKSVVLNGYSTAGKVNKVTSGSIELFKSVDTTIYTTVSDITSSDNITEAYYNYKVPAYQYGATHKSPSLTVLDAVKTFNLVSSGEDSKLDEDLGKIDDIIYLYSYDDENVFNFVVDTNSNNISTNDNSSYTSDVLEMNSAQFCGAENGKLKYYVDETYSKINSNMGIEYPFEINLNKTNIKTINSNAETVLSKYVLSGSDVIRSNNKKYIFKDTDKNKLYDSMTIVNSASFVVGRISSNTFNLYRDTSSSVFNSSLLFDENNVYEFSPLNLDTSYGDVRYTLTASTGEELTFDDIRTGDVLTVEMSTDGIIRDYEITVAKNNSIEGTISEVKSKKVRDSSESVIYYVIDGKEYKLNATADSSKLEAGVSGIFRLNADGDIMSYELDKSDLKYGIVIATAAKTGSFTSGYQAQIMTKEGNVEILDFASKCYVNDGAATDTTITAVLIPAGTIVIYETNSDNEIRKIYTTASAIEAKENGEVRVKTIAFSEYTADTGMIDGTYITKNTTVIGIPSATDVANKNAYSYASVDALADMEKYDGTVVYDTSTKEVKFAFITNLITKPSYTSIPMVITGKSTFAVDGEIRNKYTGLVNGEEVSYIEASEEGLVKLDMTGAVDNSSNARKIGVNDVIQFTLNGNNEINSYRHILDYDESNRAYFGILSVDGDSDGRVDANEDTDDAQAAQLYNLNTMQPVNSTIVTLNGYAVAGRVNKVSGRGVELFRDATRETYYELTAASNIIDAAYNPDNIVYMYGSTYLKVRTGVFDSIKTFETVYSGVSYNIATDLAKSDDIIYLYSFDGENVFNFVIDVRSDNK